MCFLLENALMRRRPATQAFVDNHGGDDDDHGDGDEGDDDGDDQHSNEETNGNAGLSWLQHRFLLLLLRIIKHLVTISSPSFRSD